MAEHVHRWVTSNAKGDEECTECDATKTAAEVEREYEEYRQERDRG